MKTKLLIQACSGRKIRTPEKLPAIQLYDGVAFRVIKKAMRENSGLTSNLKILILSAEYGLISSETKISYYDRRMNKEQSERLKTQVAEYLKMTFLDNPFEKVFINVGSQYFPTLSAFDFPNSTQFASGGIGYRNQQLKRWLLNDE